MKIYIGNLPFSYTEDNLKELLLKYSSFVSCNLIINKETGRSKGFAFAEFSENEDAMQAIKDLNGKDVGGRAIIVNKARPQEKRSPSFSFGKHR
ncbi:MAG: hypothetical protein AMS24_02910 [Chlamydiae bacterium SM23_39]|nr:MAG: hypothetical protein AMS24_02910 [Chlamydiae bacterium SM23_39]